jgi:hypothetical protein
MTTEIGSPGSTQQQWQYETPTVGGLVVGFDGSEASMAASRRLNCSRLASDGRCTCERPAGDVVVQARAWNGGTPSETDRAPSTAS